MFVQEVKCFKEPSLICKFSRSALNNLGHGKEFNCMQSIKKKFANWRWEGMEEV